MAERTIVTLGDTLAALVEGKIYHPPGHPGHHERGGRGRCL